MAIVKSLYPPIIDTYMPAFIVSEGQGTCKIYFSLSKYNNKNEIKSIWVTVNDQYTNDTMLNTRTGLLKFDFDDVEVQDDNMYCIMIQDDYIKGGWELNQLYKVQLRFCEKADLDDDAPMSDIIKYENYFSEWSTVTLIRGIQRPSLILTNFQDGLENEVIFTATNNVFTGRVEKLHSSDSLINYQFKIADKRDPNKIIYDSGICYTNEYNPNEINHFVKKGFADGESYIIYFTYETASLFKETQEFSFAVIDTGRDILNAAISAEADDENGCICIVISSTEVDDFIGNLTVRRASSKDNFEVWEDVYTTAVMSINERLNVTWTDYTVESGVWYKYCVQKRNNAGERGLIVMVEAPVMVNLHDMFLTTADKQLKIKFNPQVSSFKHTLLDSMTQTLGSKYPFVKRNGNVNYREFSISGLISHLCDENELFCSIDELYDNQTDLYQRYNDKNRITKYNDFVLERAFREKVQEFLYENNVKLFRSPSEGNILVRLMNVSFTPNQTLGRMVYSFSATAYEIDEINFETLDKYNIQKVGEYQKNFSRSYIKQHQLKYTAVGDAHKLINVKTLLQDYENENTIKGMRKNIKNFKSINIIFDSNPYLISLDKSIPVPLFNEILLGNSQNMVMGYLVEVNGERLVVSSKGCLTFQDGDVDIASLEILSFPGCELSFIVDCTYEIQEMEDVTKAVKQITYSSRIGQLRGSCDSTTSLYKQICEKYKDETDIGYQQIYALNSVCVEAEPNTVFYLKNNSKNSYDRYLIGKTGLLNIISEDYDINGLYILGVHLDEKPIIHDRIKDLEFTQDDSKIYNYIEDIGKPEKNTVYLVRDISSIDFNLSLSDSREDNYLIHLYNTIQPIKKDENNSFYRVIYFQENWYLFSKENDVIKPNQFLIDYYYELEKGVYADNAQL